MGPDERSKGDHVNVDKLLLAISPAPVTSIEQVLFVMGQIEDAVEGKGGIAAFNSLYRTTTQNIFTAIERNRFSAAGWTTRLDVIFANYYFHAISLFLAHADSTPDVWRDLFERADRTDIHPLQFAIAGMNAHINRDLSYALVDLVVESGKGWPGGRSLEFHDFEVVNDILAETEKQVKPQILANEKLIAGWDGEFGKVDDAIALWGVRGARGAAWDRAFAMFHLRGTVAEQALDSVADHAAGLLAEALLLPTGKAG
jgi:hypothetical protein